uniref:Uncharacterized protein n=1 Tax=Sphaerodactylus townsendi TaxID=933632 RepID=A0ACB8EFM5_9SAUR
MLSTPEYWGQLCGAKKSEEEFGIGAFAETIISAWESAFLCECSDTDFGFLGHSLIHITIQEKRGCSVALNNQAGMLVGPCQKETHQRPRNRDNQEGCLQKQMRM